MTTLLEELESRDLWIENIIHLNSVAVSDGFIQHFNESLYEMDDEDNPQPFEKYPILSKILENIKEWGEMNDEIGDDIRREELPFNAQLFAFRTECRNYRTVTKSGDGDTWTSGKGLTTGFWIAAESLDEAVEIALSRWEELDTKWKAVLLDDQD